MVKRKGAGYMLEAIVASLTIFVFLSGGFPSSQSQDWSNYRHQVASNDLTYVLKDTGSLRNFSKHNNPAALQSAIAGITGDRFEVAGSVEGLPLGETVVGFHIPLDLIHLKPSTVENDCTVMPLDDVSEAPIREIENETHGSSVNLLIADTDPNVTGGNDEIDYDSVYVDNGTECQFSAAEGPYYSNEIIYWGDRGGDPGGFYDVKNISKRVLLYEADQPKEIESRLEQDINGIDTRIIIDTFNFSEDLSDYDVTVFRKLEEPSYTLDQIDKNRDSLTRYMEDGSVLLLMNLTEENFISGSGSHSQFLDDIGMEWIDLNWTSRPERIEFPDTENPRKVSQIYRSLESSMEIDLLPGGNVSARPLVVADGARFDTDAWNATNFSMESNDTVIPDVPEDSCNYFNGTFDFPGIGKRFGVNMTLGCSTSSPTAGVRIDRNGDGDTADSGEGVFVNGDPVEIAGKDYRVKNYTQGVEFVYAGENKVELVNYRTSFPGTADQRLARMGYSNSYSSEQLSLVASNIHWLAGTKKEFGSGEDNLVSTVAVDSVNEEVYMPYRFNLRWSR